jgi:hypothetical protein
MQSLTLATGSDRYFRTNSGLTRRAIGCTENPIIDISPSLSRCSAFRLTVEANRSKGRGIPLPTKMLQECHTHEQYGFVLYTFERVDDGLPRSAGNLARG